uniref:Uncharacterized protein n=1 Tax=Peromyscus maniculatus bairdii TaxID=230844 RepID=A0A8C8UGF9_PERMB
MHTFVTGQGHQPGKRSFPAYHKKVKRSEQALSDNLQTSCPWAPLKIISSHLCLVRMRDECNYGSCHSCCVICGDPMVSDRERERERENCSKLVILGNPKTDLFYERKQKGFKKR